MGDSIIWLAAIAYTVLLVLAAIEHVKTLPVEKRPKWKVFYLSVVVMSAIVFVVVKSMDTEKLYLTLRGHPEMRFGDNFSITWQSAERTKITEPTIEPFAFPIVKGD